MLDNSKKNMITWRTARAWQGSSPFVVVELIPAHRSTIKKAYLVIDAHSGTLYVTREKPENLKSTGAFAEIFRKHVPHGVITGHLIQHDCDWVEIKSESRSYFICLEKKPKTILHLIVEERSLVRLSSQGSFTKSVSLLRETPKVLPAPCLQLQEHQSEIKKHESISPDYREIMPRLKRRVKTIEKSLRKAEEKYPSDHDIRSLEKKVSILQTHLHEISQGADRLEIPSSNADILYPTLDGTSEDAFTLKASNSRNKDRDGTDKTGVSDIFVELDPLLSPGGNLDKLYKELKRKKKSQSLGQLQLQKIREELKEIKDVVAAIQSGETTELTITGIYKRFGITPEKQKNQGSINGSAHSNLNSEAQLRKFREFIGFNQAIFRVSRSSEEGDRLCKSARGNDTWFHVTQGKGSHVILVSKSIRDQSPDPRQLRQGAILAVHFSNFRADRAGEVHVSLRSKIRKPKGLAAGLWLVERAESLYIRYENDELKTILGSSEEL